MKKSHKPTDRAFLLLTAIIVLVIITMMSLWAIDISVTALVLGTAEQPLFLTNGFWKTNPTQLYHSGLWLITICMISLAVICIYLTIIVFRKKIQEEKHE